jgi:hypothetical protein
MYIIYKLYDPRDQEKTPRYIGITASSLNKRYKEHINHSIHRKINRHVYNWIRLLLKENINPSIEPIDFANSKEQAFQKEISYISKFKSKGIKLTNSTDGGDLVIRKKVNQFDKEGNLINSWENASVAGKALSISQPHIISCCKGKYGRKSVGGFIWRYFEDKFDKYSHIPLKNTSKIAIRKSIIQLDENLNIIKEWQHSQEIENQLGIKRSNICWICKNPFLLNGKLRNLGGFHWFYKTDEDIVRSLRKLKIAEEVDNS